MKDKEIGPGGYKCHCCGPKPGNERDTFRRRKRRRQKQSFKRSLWIEEREDHAQV